MGYFVESEFEAVIWVPAIAVKTAPTVAELGAGTHLENDTRTINGFTARAASSEVPTLRGGFVSKVTGRQVAEDSSLVFAQHHTFALNTIQALLTDLLDGFIVWSRFTKTPVAGTKVDVFPVRVGGNNEDHTTDNRDAQFAVDFAITDIPAKKVAVAA